MQIYGPFRVSTAQNVGGAGRAGQAPKSGETAAKPTAAPVDKLDLSASAGVNRLANTSPVAGGGEIRLDKVAQLRREIADGSYETPEKLDAALESLLDQIA